MHSREELRRFILTEFSDNGAPQHLADDQSLMKSGMIDSLGILKLLAYLEETFGIFVSEEELAPENFETLERLCSFIHSKSGVVL